MKYPSNCIAPLDIMDVVGRPRKTNITLPDKHVSTRSVYKVGGRATRPVIQLDQDGNRIGEYDSITSASLATGVDIWSIQKVCAGVKKCTSGGVRWEYADPSEVTPREIDYSRNRCIITQMDEKKNVIRTFMSYKEVDSTEGLSSRSVWRAAKQGTLYRGSYWTTQKRKAQA